MQAQGMMKIFNFIIINHLAKRLGLLEQSILDVDGISIKRFVRPDHMANRVSFQQRFAEFIFTDQQAHLAGYVFRVAD